MRNAIVNSDIVKLSFLERKQERIHRELVAEIENNGKTGWMVWSIREKYYIVSNDIHKLLKKHGREIRTLMSDASIRYKD